MAASETAPPHSRWIVSPAFDLLFIVGTPLLILLIFLPAHTLGVSGGLATFVMFVMATGHHLPGFIRVYTDPELFARFRLRFLFVPPLLVAVTLWCESHDLHGYMLVAAAWGIWHGLMQLYGFARIYDAKNGEVSPATAWFDWLLCLLWFATLAVASPYESNQLRKNASEAGVSYLIEFVLAPNLQQVLTAATIAFTVVYVLYSAWVWFRRRTLSPIKLLLLTAAFLLLFVSYRDFAAAPLVSIAAWEVFHDVQYNAVVWSYNRNRALRSRLNQVGQFLFRPSWLLVGLYVLAIFLYGGIDYSSYVYGSADVRDVIHAVLVASALLHFYFDGFIWKIREPATQRDLQLRENAGSVAVPAASSYSKGWGDCITQSAMILTPVAVLGMAETWRSSLELPLFEQVVRVLPDSPNAHYQLARLYDREQRYAEASIEYEKVLALEPTRIQAAGNLAIALAKLQEYDRAVHWFNRAIDTNPSFSDSYYNLALLYHHHQRHAEALAVVRKGVAATNDPRLFTMLATMLTRCPPELRNADEAVNAAERAVDLADPGHRPEALDALAAAYAENHRWEDAVRAASEAKSLAEQNGNHAMATRIGNSLARFQSFANRGPN